MTPCERIALEALTNVSFGYGSSRWFVSNLLAKGEEYEMTGRQKWNLARLAWCYRRQLPREISDWALEFSAGSSIPPPRARSRKAVSIDDRPIVAAGKGTGARLFPAISENLSLFEANPS